MPLSVSKADGELNVYIRTQEGIGAAGYKEVH